MATAHIIDASWRSEPAIAVRIGGEVKDVPLTGSFRWTLGAERTCIGNGAPCPRNQVVSQWSQCSQCNPLESPECIFEPKCKRNPDQCSCPFGAVPHLVYIAMYGGLPKVGMTQERRESKRLTEQGADGYFVLKRFANRAEARLFEGNISFRHNIPEFRSHKATLPLMNKPQDWPRIQLAAEEWRAKLASHEPEPFQEIRSGIQPLPGAPSRAHTTGLHEGTWLGAKGKFLFYAGKKRGGMLDVGLPQVVALSRTSLEGRTISFEEP